MSSKTVERLKLMINKRLEILTACKYLQDNKLIARTWGNVSARNDNDTFIITPSGLAYDKTEKEDLVLVNIKDCSYDKSQRKPSSEKRIHAGAYELREDVNYVVHTHQFYASAICADRYSITLSDGSFVPCCKYGIPSTKKLSNNVIEIYKKFPNANMFLMANHGVITFGSTMKEALDRAMKLEAECKKIFNTRVKKFYIPENMEAYLDDYAQMVPSINTDDVEGLKLVTEKNAAAALYAKDTTPLSKLDQKIQHFIYTKKYSKLKDK